MRNIFLGEKLIGEHQPCFIVAEIGQNHQGDVKIAKRLIDVAKDSGADCVKFQKACQEEKFTRSALERPYLSPHSWGNTYGEHKAHLELSDDAFRELQEYSRKREILFTASAMDPESLDFLVSIDVPFIKIGSGDSDNLLLIEEAAKAHMPLVISTGLPAGESCLEGCTNSNIRFVLLMAFRVYSALTAASPAGMQDLEGVKRVYSVVERYHQNFALLHCVSAYPTPPMEANLKAISTMQKEFPDTLIGYSGHEEGYNLTLAAVALGAKIIERHITLDKTWKGNDHKCSLEPGELRAMIKSLREIESGLGDGVKSLMKSEIPCLEKLGKTIVASRSLHASDILKKSDLKVKVAGRQGLPPHKLSDIIGMRLRRNVNADEVISWEDLEET